jgi:hypothetical protein
MECVWGLGGASKTVSEGVGELGAQAHKGLKTKT